MLQGKAESWLGGQQVLFLKHIWEIAIKKGEKSTEPEREVFIIHAGLLPALPLDESIAKESPGSMVLYGRSFRICKGPNSKPGAFWSQNPAFIPAPGGSLFSQPVPTQPPACKMQPRL